MIYFLDNSLQLQKIVTSKNTGDIMHHEELNGLIHGNVELDLSYANKFLILGIDHVGYYYKDEFYLHKIQRVEYDHVNESVKVVFRHIFFEDMLFGPIIKDVRPKNQDAVTILRQTIEANTRWQIVMTDVTGTLSTNFYWQVPYEVIEFVNKNFRVDMFPKILFDGKNINGFQLHVKNASSSEVKQRIPFGSRVLDLKYEEDFSEIVTKLVGHGKGEEVGDGYGRRINFSEINFNRNGVKSPVGSVYMENPSITNTYGNDGQTPREGRVVFEDIESPSELAEATYQHYLDVSRPQMLFTADVANIGDVSIGDSVLIVRREYDVYFKARIHRLSVNLLNPEDAQVELGDYEHFKESKVERKTRQKNDQFRRNTNSRIEQLKRDFDVDFDAAVEQMKADFEQALIDAYAEIEAVRVRLTEEIEGVRDDWTTEFNEEMDAAYALAEQNYTAIRDRITTEVSTARSDLEKEIDADVAAAKLYAEQQAEEKANNVQTNLDAVTESHAGIIADLQSDVVDFDAFKTGINTHVQDLIGRVGGIDDYLGDITNITLDDRLQEVNRNFEERIRNVDTQTYNMLRGTRFDESGKFSTHNGGELNTNEDINFVRLKGDSTWSPYVKFLEPFTIEEGKRYIIAMDYRTDTVPELDGIYFEQPDGALYYLHAKNDEGDGIYGLQTDGAWNRTHISFISDRTQSGLLRVGPNFGGGDTTRGDIDVRLVYVTSTSNTDWIYNPLDATQSIESVTRRITQLEDGRKELITRSEWDSENNFIMQTVRDIEETVDTSRNLIQEIENYDVILRGSEVLQTVDGFANKVWLNDFASIGANLLPQSANAWEDGGIWIASGEDAALNQNIRMKSRIKIRPNTTYTLSSNSTYVSAIERVDIHQYLYTGGWINRYTIPARGEVSFTTWGTADTVRVTLIAREGFAIPTSFIDHIDGRIKIKLEEGDSATPMLSAISKVEQLANRVSIEVAELDGDFVTQSQFDVTTDEISALVSRTDSNETQIGNLSVSYDEISSTVLSMDSDLESQGTWISQTDNLISSKVWMNDVADINPNLLPFNDFLYKDNRDKWNALNSNSTAVTSSGSFRVRHTDSSTYIAVESPNFQVVAGEEYTFHFKGSKSNISGNNFDRTYRINDDGKASSIGTAWLQSNGRHAYKFTADKTGNMRVIIGAWAEAGRDISIYISKPKVERGWNETPYMQAFSVVEQMANEVRIAVQGIDGMTGVLTQSDISVTSGQIRIGSQQIGGSQLASVLTVSPSAMDVITSNLNITGNVNVKGDIEALALSAVNADIANLRARILVADSIDSLHIQTDQIITRHIRMTNALAEKIIANTVMADSIKTLSLDAIEINAGRVRSAILESDVILSSHINSSNALIEKIFATSARIDTLITKNHFVNNIKALTIEAVEADIANIRSKLLTSDVILSSHLNASNALIDKIFSETAYISRLTTKSAFIRDIQAIEITATQLNLNTLRNRFNEIEGGLHIRRHDHYVSGGVEYGMYIQNGIPNMDVDVQRNQFMHSGVVNFTGQSYQLRGSNMNSSQMYNCETIYTSHKSKYITVGFGMNISGIASRYVLVELREFGSGNLVGSHRQFVSDSGGTHWANIRINLGVPDYNSAKSFYVSAGVENPTSDTYLQLRVNRVNMHG